MYGPRESIARLFANYVNFEGRATRSEYWWPVLMQTVVLIILAIPLIGSLVGNPDAEPGPIFWLSLGLMAIFSLAIFLPMLAVAVRRFHDLNQTGWLVLIFYIAGLIIPFAGIAQLIWFAVPGTQGANNYGEDPFDPQANIFN